MPPLDINALIDSITQGWSLCGDEPAVVLVGDSGEELFVHEIRYNVDKDRLEIVADT